MSPPPRRLPDPLPLVPATPAEHEQGRAWAAQDHARWWAATAPRAAALAAQRLAEEQERSRDAWLRGRR